MKIVKSDRNEVENRKEIGRNQIGIRQKLGRNQVESRSKLGKNRLIYYKLKLFKNNKLNIDRLKYRQKRGRKQVKIRQ